MIYLGVNLVSKDSTTWRAGALWLEVRIGENKVAGEGGSCSAQPVLRLGLHQDLFGRRFGLANWI